MAESTVVKNARDGTIAITNGTRTYTVALEADDFSFSGANAGNYERTPIEDRGEFSHNRKTKRKYIAFTFTAWMRDISDATDVTLPSICLQTGACASDVSTAGANADSYEVTIVWTVNGTVHGDAANHSITMTRCTVDSVDIAEAEDKNTVSISGTCYSTITYA